jgi:hypothetical protein
MGGEDTHYLEETYGTRKAMPRERMLDYGKAVLLVVGADGAVTDGEMRMLQGILAAMGAPSDVRQILRTWDWKSGRLEDLVPALSADPENPGEIVAAFLYDAIRVSRADGYSEKERAAVARAARTLGIGPTTVIAVEQLVEAEAALRKLRLALLNPSAARFPQGDPGGGLR